jgi:hypothetical protein
MKRYGRRTEVALRELYGNADAACEALPDLLDELDTLRQALFDLHETALGFALRLQDGGLYGRIEDLAGGSNQKALAQSRKLLQEHGVYNPGHK